MHLHVSQLSAAQKFYVDVFGFESMQRYGGQALFVAQSCWHRDQGGFVLAKWDSLGLTLKLDLHLAGCDCPVTGLPEETANDLVSQ